MSQKEPLFTECPCCKQKTFELPLKPKQDDLQLYMACLLSGQPFKKTYSLWDGRIKIEATEISQQKLIAMQKVATKLAFADHGQISDMLKIISDVLFNKAYITKIMLYKDGQQEKVYDIEPIWYKAIQEVLKAQTKEDLQKILKVLTSPQNVSAVSMSLLQKVVKTHNSITELLSLSGFDADFFGDLLLE